MNIPVRYDLVKINCGYDGHDHVMEPCEDGEWVRWEEADIAIRDAKLDTVRALIPEVQHCAYVECILPHGHRESCKTRVPMYQEVSCSHCQRSFGPGEHGFSHCENHKGMVGTR